jgi:tetratricopeptide (TPR) repeat protein
MSHDKPSELSVIWDEARSCIDKGELDKAVETYRYILIMYAENLMAVERANASLGDIFLMKSQVDVAEVYIKKAIRLNPEKAAYRYLLGFIYSKQFRWEEAIREFRKAVSREPSHDEFHRGLGWAVYNTGDILTGISILHTAYELNPGNVNTLTDLAVAYTGIANFRQARRYIRMALDLDPRNPLIIGAYWNIDYFQHMCHLEGEE